MVNFQLSLPWPFFFLSFFLPSLLLLLPPSLPPLPSFLFFKLFIYLAALDPSCSRWDLLVTSYRIFHWGTQTLSCGMWDLVPCPGIKSSPPALGSGSFRHWATREVPPSFFLSLFLSFPLSLSLSLSLTPPSPFSLSFFHSLCPFLSLCLFFLSLPPSLSHCLWFLLSHLASQMLTPQLYLLQPTAFSMLLFPALPLTVRNFFFPIYLLFLSSSPP